MEPSKTVKRLDFDMSSSDRFDVRKPYRRSLGRFGKHVSRYLPATVDTNRLAGSMIFGAFVNLQYLHLEYYGSEYSRPMVPPDLSTCSTPLRTLLGVDEDVSCTGSPN
jgi:hypothetical protein